MTWVDEGKTRVEESQKQLLECAVAGEGAKVSGRVGVRSIRILIW